MRRIAAILIVASLVAPTAAAQPDVIPGDYPEPIRNGIGEVLADEREDAPAEAERYLDRARTELEEGNVSMAIENYVFYEVTAEEAALAERLENRSASEGQRIADRQLERMEQEGRASAGSAMSFLDEIELANLTKQGLDTALWGSALVAEGRTQLTMHEEKIERNVYPDGELDRDRLGERVATAHGGTVLVNLGLEIASKADQVGGQPLDPAETSERLAQAANMTIETRGGMPSYLPEAPPDASPLVRAGLTHVSIVESKTPEFYRIFGPQTGEETLAQMEKALRFDRNRLGPYADAGFPLAQAGFESVAFLGTDQLDDPARPTPQRGHAQAFAASEIVTTVFPNATEETSSESPAVTVVGVLATLGGTAVAARRRAS